ncbi:MAG: DegT/DnrJ/EryC1/StrS family aminotransferase [Syntrophomonadaceae bacterium]|jgi:dTDP-4-amino-4,6-dideoxygalactose transaminase|nr:DegT/DnrJ/EryC1/StrS family aminotransferase [Syntrophomonadaceae bacterium]
MTVPLLDLAGQYRRLQGEIDAAMRAVLERGSYIMGPEVGQFEEEMAQYLGVRHAIGVGSGSDALLLSLQALGIGPGDEVIVPAFTFFATAGAVTRLGATPVFVDIEREAFHLDLDMVEDLLRARPKVKALIPVHLFGRPCDMPRLMEMAVRFGVWVVEDACQAIGATLSVDGRPRMAGTIGDTGCFSFFPSKNLGCFGDGGMVVTNDDRLADRIRLLRVHGARPKYHHLLVGCNSRLDTLQAAVLRVKLRHLPEWNAGRVQVAGWYREEFARRELAGAVRIPDVVPGHVFHQYVIAARERDALAAHLAAEGIGTAVYYPEPLHLQECFAFLGYAPGSLPGAEAACAEVLALPIDPALAREQVEQVVGRIAAFYRREGR